MVYAYNGGPQGSIGPPRQAAWRLVLIQRGGVKLKAYRVDHIRNVGLYSHGGAGKTSLGEEMLFNARAINRVGRVEDGATTSDYEPEEARRRISVNLALLPLEWNNHKINIVDCPGFLDFAGEIRQGMRAADSAIVLVDGVAGVEVGTEQVWRQLQLATIPRLIFVNKFDRENADFTRTVDQLRERFGNTLIAIQMPIGGQDQFSGVIDLISMVALRGPNGTAEEIPKELREAADRMREKLVETVAESDDDLLIKFLEGEEISNDEIRVALRRAIASSRIFPILVGSATQNKAVSQLMDAIVELMPSPADCQPVEATESGVRKIALRADDNGPIAALVFKTTADPFVGKLTYFRVISGLMKSDSMVWNALKVREERIGQLFVVRGKSQEPVQTLGAGDIGAVAKLQHTGTGDTLSTKDRPVLLPAIEFPHPNYSVAVEPKSKADLDKLGSALHRLVEEDATIRVRRDTETFETVISGLGETQIDVAVERMHRKFGIDVVLHEPRVPYRETVLRSTRTEYKHKKQTGGHGQYGHVVLEIEPLSRGAGFQFGEKVVGGSVPKNYVPAVEKGIREALPEGIVAGFPVVDLKVTLCDGSYHPVDSSEMAFKLASGQAFKKGAEQAGPVLLEPVMDMAIVVPEQFVGDVMSDLNSKRGRVQGMDPDEGMTTVHAQAPLAEIQRYANDLRSISQGRGTFSMKFSHYEEVPQLVAQHVIADARKVHAIAH